MKARIGKLGDPPVPTEGNTAVKISEDEDVKINGQVVEKEHLKQVLKDHRNGTVIIEGSGQPVPKSQLYIIPKYMYRSASVTELELVRKRQDITAKAILKEAENRPERRSNSGATEKNGIRTIKGGDSFTLREWIANGHTKRQDLRGNTGFMTFTANPAVAVQYSAQYRRYLQKHSDQPKHDLHILRFSVQRFLDEGGKLLKLRSQPASEIADAMLEGENRDGTTPMWDLLVAAGRKMRGADKDEYGKFDERIRGSMFADSHSEWQVDLLKAGVSTDRLLEEINLQTDEEFLADGWRKPNQGDYVNLNAAFQGCGSADLGIENDDQDDTNIVPQGEETERMAALKVPTHKSPQRQEFVDSLLRPALERNNDNKHNPEVTVQATPSPNCSACTHVQDPCACACLHVFLCVWVCPLYAFVHAHARVRAGAGACAGACASACARACIIAYLGTCYGCVCVFVCLEKDDVDPWPG